MLRGYNHTWHIKKKNQTILIKKSNQFLLEILNSFDCCTEKVDSVCYYYYMMSLLLTWLPS